MADTEQTVKELEKDIHEATEHMAETIHNEEVHHGHQIGDATFWVAVATLLFVLLLIYLKVPKTLASALDKKSREIEEELDNARTLREEASALLAKYQRDQREAEKTAEDLLKAAEEEARALAEDAKRNIQDMVDRRTRLAEQKINQAEAAAVKEIRQLAANVATSAARQLIAENLKKEDQDALLKASIDGLDAKLH